VGVIFYSVVPAVSKVLASIETDTVSPGHIELYERVESQRGMS
jgi:hypothetical protein